MNETNIKRIEGGVTYPAGFRASGIHCGLRKNKSKKDLALILADKPCNAAAVYTTNKVYGAPITVTREHLKNGMARAAICNSGNANTCNPDGVDKANAMCAALAAQLGIDENDIIIASTGVIGEPLPLEPILSGIPALCDSLGYDAENGYAAASAIMTTDTRLKQIAAETVIDGVKVKIGGMSKGSGMIQPNMATMLCFVTTDANISSEVLQVLLRRVADRTFNMISVDGDTSTNDTFSVMASGLAGNALIENPDSESGKAFEELLEYVCKYLARKMAADGEGASKLLECRVHGCDTLENARILAKSVINSPLVKTAMFGADANWGRILCALGYAGVEFDPHKVDVSFISDAGEINVCKNGGSVGFDEDKAKEILLKDSIVMDVNMNMGNACAAAYGCDLTYEYVRINGDYRS
ncbi:MAG: bifunctional glutamate N-acetyltransferase/amino-acid acetyltransferase ArgJ [Eubacteriales bacterium]|jgi:glutamate N-acetyltransferase/amino-acid N-acetyltransferase